ncbi:MAG: response regulator [Candidatus Gastranaerophilales bacterium]|nr:response regulator [Candidatus Gastranaerophilales bacterium]
MPAQKRILIMEKDEALRLLVETSCLINGFDAMVCDTYEKYFDCLESYKPDLIVLDYGTDANKEGFEALNNTKRYYSAADGKMPAIIFSTTILDKKSILAKGADYYLPKPYDIQALMDVIADFLKEFN